MKRKGPANESSAISPVQAVIERTITDFIHVEVSGSVVLLIAAIVTLVLANSPWSEQYLQFWQVKIGFKVGSFEFYETLQHWINGFLMAFFFFVVGLEIKREVVAGVGGYLVLRLANRGTEPEGA